VSQLSNTAELKRNEGGGNLRSAAEQETKDETATLLKTMQQVLTDLQKEVKGLKSKQTPRDQNLRQCHYQRLVLVYALPQNLGFCQM
jgi:hypothetical protein